MRDFKRIHGFKYAWTKYGKSFLKQNDDARAVSFGSRREFDSFKAFDALSLFLSNIETKFSIMGLSETWLQHSDSLVDMSGYKFIHNHRLNRAGGGVGLYCSDDLNYKVRKDLNYDSDCAESLFIEIVKPRGKSSIVGVVYRPPGQNVNEFIVNTDCIISKISRENKKCFIMVILI